MIRVRTGAALVAAAMLAASGCSSIDDSRPTTLIPARTLDISPSLTIRAESVAAAGLIYAILDPLAPNWKVEVQPLPGHRFRIAMTMKRFIVGGEGEVGPVLRRTAEKLARDHGYFEYSVVEQSEGIESRVTIPQRVAHAIVELR